MNPDAGSVTALSPLRVVEYRRLLVGTFVSSVGLFFHTVAASWVMLELTGSPFMVGLVSASAFLPRLIASIPAGALADIVDRRAILLWSHVGSSTLALYLAFLQFTGALTPAYLVVLSLGLGLGASLSIPAYQAIVPDLLPRPQVSSAVSLHSGAFNVARAVGPALGGVLVGAGQADIAFALNGLSYLFVTGAVLTFRDRSFRAGEPEPVGRAMATGLRYIRYTPLFLRVVSVTALFALASASVQPLLPNIAEDTLRLGARGYGLLYACFGGGAFVGAVTREQGRLLVPGRGLIPFSIIGFGLAGVGFGLSTVPWVSAALIAVVGFFWVWTLATLNTIVQLSSPGWVRGRAMSLYLLAFTGSIPLGSLFAGAVAESIGAARTVAIFSAATVAVGVAAVRVGIPSLSEIVAPERPDGWDARPHQAIGVAGGPVVVVTDWEIEPDDLAAFLDAMRELRRHRLRTGATRWVLFRNAGHPDRMTEVFEVADWEEHLRQHDRIDVEAAAAIGHARAFDRTGEPRSTHLVGIDVQAPEGPPAWEDLLAVHEGRHRLDGSVPLGDEEVV